MTGSRQVLIVSDKGPSGELVLRLRRYEIVARALLGVLCAFGSVGVITGVVAIFLPHGGLAPGVMIAVMSSAWVAITLPWIANSTWLSLSARRLAFRYGPFAIFSRDTSIGIDAIEEFSMVRNGGARGWGYWAVMVRTNGKHSMIAGFTHPDDAKLLVRLLSDRLHAIGKPGEAHI